MYSDGSRTTPHQLIRDRANVQVSLVEVPLNQPVAGSRLVPYLRVPASYVLASS